MIVLSVVLITMALIFYSIGVWSEFYTKFLKKWHLVAFWLGFIFDVSGTIAMHNISDNGFDLFEPHTLTGQIALWLMFIHSIWASVVVIKGSDYIRSRFHKYSIIVWVIWLIPYFGGMYIAM